MIRAIGGASFIVFTLCALSWQSATPSQSRTSSDVRPGLQLPPESAGWDKVVGGYFPRSTKLMWSHWELLVEEMAPICDSV